MVVDELREAELDRLFQAFADSTRRDIVRRVSGGGLSVSGLAGHYAMSFAAVQKHVAVLERAGLVSKERRGREQLVRANRDGLERARQLLDEYEAIWRQRVGRIADILAVESANRKEAP
jgi:DNA-binding transcriptional ArsR family regulator